VKPQPLRPEMEDLPEDLRAPARLGGFLRRCDELIREPFREADQRAVCFQRKHRRLTTAVTVTGTLALWLTSLSFLYGLARPSLWFEAACVAATFLLVGAGLVVRWQGKWLLWRFKAERYCLLKFRMLAEPLLWTSESDQGWSRRLEKEADRIRRLEHQDLDGEASREEVACVAPPGVAGRVDPQEMARLAAYYRRRRLSPQIAYFNASARKVRPANRLWAPLVFFASVLFSGAQVGMELGARLSAPQTEDHAHDFFLRLFLLISLWLPALFAGVRTYQAANEFARNRSRSLARAAALSEIAARLPEATREALDPDPASLLTNLALCEAILSADQREWLRLMLDAEWYR
jgi:hypothetical protein